jgi:hydrogen cyanide synthase HcnC
MRKFSDVVVIGGGVIGSSVAFSLARLGASVTLLDASTPGRATSASAGGLWSLGESLGLGCGVILHTSQQGAGAEPAPLPLKFMDFLWESNLLFPNLATELLTLCGINIEAESATGLLYLIYDESQESHASRIISWAGSDHGALEQWGPQRIRDRDPLITHNLRNAIHFPGDNQVNPILLNEALKRGACAKGACFIAEARVHALRCNNRRIVEVYTLASIEIPVQPVRGQIICTEALQPGTLRSNLSTRDCYILQKGHGEIIIGSTTEYSDFSTKVRYEDICNLAAGAIRAVPALRNVTLKRSWSGLRPGTPDELPILGPAAELENFFHATGGFRTGIVAAPLTGEVVAASVLGLKPKFPIESFLAHRFQRVYV